MSNVLARIKGIQDNFSDFSTGYERRTQYPSPLSLRMLSIPFLPVAAIDHTCIGETVRWLRERLNRAEKGRAVKRAVRSWSNV